MSGDIETREASGAVVWGTKDTSGSHGTIRVWLVYRASQAPRIAYIVVFLLLRTSVEDHSNWSELILAAFVSLDVVHGLIFFPDFSFLSVFPAL